MLKDNFGCAENHEKAKYCLEYRLTLTRNSDISVLNKKMQSIMPKCKINGTEWYIPHYTQSMEQRKIKNKQILSKVPTELQYVERSISMKKVNTRNFWTFELGTEEGINVPIWFIVGFQQRDRQNSQNLKNDIFYRPPLTSTQCIMRTENYPDSDISINYDDDGYSQRYAQTNQTFGALTKDDILNLYLTDQDCRSTNVNIAGEIDDSVGNILYVFRYTISEKL